MMVFMTEKANPSQAASELAKLGASKGGHARASSLSSAQRSTIARNAVNQRWQRAGKEIAPEDLQRPVAQQHNRRPDPKRVEAWRAAIEEIKGQISHLEWFRDEFRDFEKIVRENPRILYGESYFPAHIKHWYVESQAMRVRRLVEPLTPGYEVWSLLQLLEDMRRAAEAFSRAEIEGLFDKPGAPDYDLEMRDFLVASMWRGVGDVEKDADRLYARQIKEDIKALHDSTDEIKRFADLVYAHNAKEVPAAPKFSAISAAVDEIVRLGKRYYATLTGASMMSFAPVYQGNWYDIFMIPWIDSSGDRPDKPNKDAFGQAS
jgi:hypothetical protein